MSLIDDIKRDREAASDFHWIGETLMATDFGEVIELCSVDWSPLDELKAENKRRIARVPAMESALLAAEELAEKLGEALFILECDDPERPIVSEAKTALTAYREALK